MLVSDFLVTLRARLFDPSPGAGWADAELIGYLNMAQQRVAFLKPDAFAQHTDLALVAGTQQTLPAGAVGLLEIPRNTSGRVVEQVDYDMLKASDWMWPAGTASTTIECYAADPRDPLKFHVSPPAAVGAVLRVVYGAVPPTLTASGDTIALVDSYADTLTDGVLAMAYGKPSQRQNLQQASYHQQLFDGALGVKTKAQYSVAPAVSRSPGQ